MNCRNSVIVKICSQSDKSTSRNDNKPPPSSSSIIIVVVNFNNPLKLNEWGGIKINIKITHRFIQFLIFTLHENGTTAMSTKCDSWYWKIQLRWFFNSICSVLTASMTMKNMEGGRERKISVSTLPFLFLSFFSFIFQRTKIHCLWSKKRRRKGRRDRNIFFPSPILEGCSDVVARRIDERKKKYWKVWTSCYKFSWTLIV